MKALKITLILAAVALAFYFQREFYFGPNANSGVRIASLKAPPHVLNTLRFAVEAANDEARTLVYHFSLANCAPCDRIDAEVLGTREWKEYARANLKVMDLFMPNEFTGDDVRIVKNMELIETVHSALHSFGGFPAVVVISSDGRLIGIKVGYDGSRAAGYIAWVEKMRQGDPNRPKVPKPVAPSVAPLASVPAVATNVVPSSAVPVAVPTPAVPAAAASVPAGPAPLVTNTVTPVAEVAKPAPESFLKLKGILGGKQPLAIIDSGTKTYTLGAGDARSLDTPAGKVAIHCDTVGKDVVTLLVGDAKVRQELRLP